MLLGATTATHALPCDELRQSIESGIRARGVTDFRVVAVDAAASAAGQVVGRCDHGARKLVYQRGAAGTAAAAAPAARPAAAASAAPGPHRPPRPAVITECADGRVITGGSCRR